MPVKSKKRPGRPKDKALIARRCEEILDAAAQIFAAQGYRNTDVQLVADRLNIGKGTVYRYFPSKRNLFLAAVDRGMRRLRTQIETCTANIADPLERIVRAISAYLTFFDTHPEFVELIIQERAEFKDRAKPTYFEHRDANVGPWQELFRELMRAGRVREMPVERITDVLGNLLYGTMFTNYFAGRQKPFEVQAQDILDIVFYGILSEQERKGCPPAVDEGTPCD
ncbi:MAG: TetR/AcrR family transcriptional regulator [Nitrospinota bacterium]|nr:MAG: TetR/AcrR family transcriptional regulator [Nitrospinota bacterium]